MSTAWRLTRLNGEFCVTWDSDGKRHRFRLGTRDHKEATQRAANIHSRATRPKGRTVKDLWDGYCLDHADRAVLATMKHTWKALQDRFGHLEPEDVTIEHCRLHTVARRQANISDGTIHTELGHLRMVCLWAVRHNIIDRAPTIERPSKPEPKDAHLTRDEIGRLIDAAGAEHVKTAIMLMIGTGARNEAAMQLTWDRVDFARGMIQLRNPFDRAKRKGRATIPMNDTLRDRLELAHKAALTPFVIEWAGRPVKSIKKGLKAAGVAIGRPDVSPHMLRRSAAIWMVEDGHSFEEVAQFLGHGDVNVTRNVYARFSSSHLRKLAKSLEV